MAPDAWALRAADADRERAASFLREHALSGRLSFDELDERLERVYTARTYSDLRELSGDLPGPAVAPPVTVSAARAPASSRGRGIAVGLVALAALSLAPAVLSLVVALGMMAVMTLWMAGPFVLVAILVVWAVRRLPTRLEPPPPLEAPRSSWPAR